MNTYQQLKRNLKQDLGSFPVLKVALLGDSATQMLATAIRGEGVVRGYNIHLWEAEYSQVERQMMDASSDLHQQDFNYIIVFQSTHKLMEQHALMQEEEEKRTLAEERLEFVRSICDHCPTHIIYFNYPEIEDAVFGSYANKVETSFSYQVRKLNLGLMQLAQEKKGLFICDLCGIQNKIGRDRLFDPAVYVSTEMLLSIDALPLVAGRTLDIVCATEGKVKKCLILDLDNTLWGGVVGDDGWENIQIGHGLGIGKAFTEFQEWIRKLKQRGIIVAVCSKNDEEKARAPFEKNPEMVLKLEDIAVFVANWNNKADNIRHIQEVLHIGFDSMVFLDDNPFERNLVRENIPDITVPELPEDPGLYLEYLYSLNLFETASYSSADQERTRQYQVQSQRVSASKSFTNEEDFLKSLNMESEVSIFTTFNTPRVAQLSQRSNQFNLRTIRYTEDQIMQMGASHRYAPFCFTLEDKFGDNGLIGVIILTKENEETLFVDTWFMSCRVLKRGMENMMLNTIVGYAKQNGFKHIIGEYLPTTKNGMVAEHYDHLGFTPLKETKTKQYKLEVDAYQPRKCYIKTKEK
ncbi:MAG: HAD-IIIC family phosphatase [Bacteroidales bacterium]|nr:HAD-IIIC family phosphatase [Bacteroidales bacterium]